MYKVIKDNGNNQNVFLVNTETNTQVCIGRVNKDVAEIAYNEVMTYNDYRERSVGEWDIKITTAQAQSLSKLTMKMGKPIRIREEKKADKPKVNALDVLLGQAEF